jgi:predicted NACHT family NTPase
MGNGKVANWVFPKERSFSEVIGKSTRRSFHLLVGATLATGLPIVGALVTASLDRGPRWLPLLWGALLIVLNALNLRWQLRSQEERPEAIKERVSQLQSELRKQVQARSYGTRRNMIEAPLRELDLDMTPRVGWVRDPRLVEPEPLSERIADDDIVATFESSKRRLLLVGEPGSGKTMAAYSLIEYLDETEGAEGRVPLLVNLSAWEAQESFEAFLVDYLCSSVGYEVPERAVASAFTSSDGYDLILDGLVEIPLRLRAHFSERLDEFVRELAGEVGVVTCRTQEYEELLAAHPTGLGLVQAVEILPLSSEQLDSTFVELAQRDKDWDTFLSQRHLTAYKRVRHLLSNPLFLNLAVTVSEPCRCGAPQP